MIWQDFENPVGFVLASPVLVWFGPDKTRISTPKSYSWRIWQSIYFDSGLLEDTPLRSNMSPENQRLENVFPTEIVPF